MPRRYDKIRNEINDEGYWRKETTYYLDIPLQNNDIYVMTQWGDRFDLLASQYYNDPSLWWVIAKANGLKGKVFVPQDTEIRIPGNVSKVLEDFNNLNN